MDLIADGIIKNYGHRQVVKGVSLRVRSGEIVGLLGPNGAGKTTTFYSLVGFLHPEGGAIRIDDHDVTDQPMYQRARKGLGYLAQEPTVFQGLTVEENLRAILERTIPDEEEQRAKAKSLLEEFGLWRLQGQEAWTLSGGEKRRLEVARAMIQNPKIILLDEPFVGIDPITVGELKQMIFKLKNSGIGVLITDHNVRETLPIIDRAYLIFDGKILLDGTSQDLINDAKAREIYLGEDFQI
ncbi:MAG: LPS export ABC transporter ATP-binding protein [Elusimicrobia bacterium CG1_02_63_36]|nr:MAG: LPS export ABC transporter ATP-binding protein [Elusimicrobia bacterium CG1_02_63_36]PIP81943.1 MAG: LPS export ABC transporter ATP-binding protein [Elusimicrobia bacterium CG22_combo_CG10-13_8_21_14_all_63_91]PJA18497.1 MAG: LPS export ABC transporter ATP-binding protein [Elusimicrobia bacterium CG_4_10_14_0_2_um_filter_63_34]PJB24479.1 MAG: LPS export ABC transporter ATP-binding protein [Elusimicrobia bacterium CG_4_9_14_3_um_filter_62_55]